MVGKLIVKGKFDFKSVSGKGRGEGGGGDSISDGGGGGGGGGGERWMFTSCGVCVCSILCLSTH